MSAARRSSAKPPPPGTYWVEPGRFLAGEYPGSREPEDALERVAMLLDAGVDYFVDLTWPGELPPYDTHLPSPYSGGTRAPVTYSRRPIKDHGLPREALHMIEILDELDDALDAGHCVYVHCRAGIGRTGTVVGCHLARRLGSGTEALAALDELWARGGRDRVFPSTPETDEQVDYVRAWCEFDRPATARAEEAVARVVATRPRDGRHAGAPERDGDGGSQAAASLALQRLPPGEQLRERVRGLVFGLAIGDALGMPVQGRRPGSFMPIGEFVGGGPHDLPRGAWTDDTSLALLLAESLAERNAFDVRDQVERYGRWQREGYLSSTGKCVGISATTARALAQAKWSGSRYMGSHDPARAEKEPLVRAGIAAAWATSEPERAIALAAEAPRTTHQAPLVLDACRYFGALVVGALQGVGREALLAPYFTPVPGLWERRPLKPEIAAIAAGGWRCLPEGRPTGAGTAADALATVLWLLGRAGDFRELLLVAVNLGHDADTNGALAGLIGGALYGQAAIPASWRAGLVRADLIAGAAEALHAAVLRRPAGA